MAEEITEIDRNKYIVIKKEDVNKYLMPKGLDITVEHILGIIGLSRQIDNKPQFNEYLVLNIDDEIDLMQVLTNLQDSGLLKIIEGDFVKEGLKVRDLATALMNAVLKAKKE
jgi:hypothetical protein